jgi:hypothetical protein
MNDTAVFISLQFMRPTAGWLRVPRQRNRSCGSKPHSPRFGPCARIRIVVSGYVNERSLHAFGHVPLAEFDAGHAAEPDVEHQAVELRMLRVREERLR